MGLCVHAPLALPCCCGFAFCCNAAAAWPALLLALCSTPPCLVGLLCKRLHGLGLRPATSAWLVCAGPLRSPLPRPTHLPAAEVLDLMQSMLGFTAEDRAKIAESRRRQGWREISLASDVAAPGGGPPGGKASLADSWVDFLQQQIEADAAAAGGGKPAGAGAAPDAAVGAAPDAAPGAHGSGASAPAVQQQAAVAPAFL